jgi:hypothetical protein
VGKLTILIALFNAIVACAGFPPVPDIEVKLVDQKNAKIHYYLIPKREGESAPFLRSEPLTLSNLNKNFAIDPKNYSILETYLSEVSDHAKEKCQ